MYMNAKEFFESRVKPIPVNAVVISDKCCRMLVTRTFCIAELLDNPVSIGVQRSIDGDELPRDNIQNDENKDLMAFDIVDTEKIHCP